MGIKRLSVIKTDHPRDVWFKITHELTCQTPVDTLFPQQDETKPVDLFPELHTKWMHDEFSLCWV